MPWSGPAGASRSVGPIHIPRLSEGPGFGRLRPTSDKRLVPLGVEFDGSRYRPSSRLGSPAHRGRACSSGACSALLARRSAVQTRAAEAWKIPPAPGGPHTGTSFPSSSGVSARGHSSRARSQQAASPPRGTEWSNTPAASDGGATADFSHRARVSFWAATSGLAAHDLAPRPRPFVMRRRRTAAPRANWRRWPGERPQRGSSVASGLPGVAPRGGESGPNSVTTSFNRSCASATRSSSSRPAAGTSADTSLASRLTAHHARSWSRASPGAPARRVPRHGRQRRLGWLSLRLVVGRLQGRGRGRLVRVQWRVRSWVVCSPAGSGQCVSRGGSVMSRRASRARSSMQTTSCASIPIRS